MATRRHMSSATSFSSGQLDETMEGRTDTKIYKNGARELDNCSLLVQGGVRTRPGSVRWGTSGLDSIDAILRPFIFNEDQNYIVRIKKKVTTNDIHVWNTATEAISGAYTVTNWNPPLEKIRVAQRGDVMILTDAEGHEVPIVLTRTGAASFTLAQYVFEVDPLTCVGGNCKSFQPFYKHVDPSVTLTPGATTGTGITFTASASVFTANHVGTYIRYQKKQIYVQTYVGGTQVTGDIIETLPATTADTDWDEQAFSVERGWPRTCCFHQSRFWFGGSFALPAHMFSSKVGAYYNFDVGTGLDDESIQAPIDSTSVNTIKHLVSHTTLAVFTDAAEFYVPETESAPLTPGSYSPRRVSSYGSADALPVVFDEAILFVQKNNAVVREFVYDDLQQNYTSRAVSLVSTDIISDVVETAVQYGVEKGSEQYAYFVRSDGTVSVYHGVRGENIRGIVPWSGYSYLSAAHNVVSLVVIQEKLYGYVESTHFSDRSILDFSLMEFSYDYPFDEALQKGSGDKFSADTWTVNINWAGDEVWVALAKQIDGKVVPLVYVGQKTVDVNGRVTITGADNWDDIWVGIPVQVKGELLPIHIEDQEGSHDGDPVRLIRASFNIKNGSALVLGCRERFLTAKWESPYPDPSDFDDTVDKQLDIWRLGWDREASICFGTDINDPTSFLPMPFKLVSVTRKVEY